MMFEGDLNGIEMLYYINQKHYLLVNKCIFGRIYNLSATKNK